MKAATFILFSCLLVGVVLARHTKSHASRDGSGEGTAASPAADWPSPGALGSFDVPPSFTQDLGAAPPAEGTDSESEGKSAKRKSHKH